MSLPYSVFGEEVIDSESIVKFCPVPQYPNLAEGETLPSGKSYRIKAQNQNMQSGKIGEFTGGVYLYTKDQTIKADAVTIDRDKSEVIATGNIHYQNQGINIFAEQLAARNGGEETELLGTNYQLTGIAGHGGADQIIVTQSGTLNLNESSFTTCYGETPVWELKASEIQLSSDETFGKAYHAKFNLMGVPVMYLPYYSFPITDDRQTGLLYPKFKSSSLSGIEVEAPFYWNIAPNMDATITPHYMSKRGLRLITEFRYLLEQHVGQVDLEYLNEDKKYLNDDPRYLARWQHTGNFGENYRAYVDVTTISDDNYLVDIGSKQYSDNDPYMYQIGELAYFSDNWSMGIRAQDFQVLGNYEPNYKLLPQIDFNFYQELGFMPGTFELFTEASQFVTNNLNLPEAERVHIEAGFNFPYVTPAWFLNSEFKVLQTNYRQTNIDLLPELESSVSRTLPKIRLHSGVNFDRSTALIGDGYTQTLEPQVQYLYIPYEDQSTIGLYDTTQLQDDYNGLFRDTRYSGLDRIAEANQVSWGVTSRILDQSNQELFHLSLGQIVYLDDIFVDPTSNQPISVSESAIASDLFLRLGENWQFSSDIQYDTALGETNKSQFSVDYRFNKNSIIQLNHRYARNVSLNVLEQASLLTSFPITKDWTFVGRYTRDLQLKRSIEGYAGLQYDSCCWSVRVAYHRHIIAKFDDNTTVDQNAGEFDTGFMIQFDIKAQDITEMFDESIFGYKRPYFLNN